MKKNTLLSIIALVLLAGIAYFLSQKKSSGLGSIEDRKFKIEDINQVGSITIERQEYPTTYFTRSGDKWQMNNGKEVNMVTFGNFLNLLQKVDIDYIPNRSMTDNILTNIKDNNVHIIIKDKAGNELKNYYIGTELGSNNDTPFLMAGHSQPYILRVPGFTGAIRSRILRDMNEWENKEIFRLRHDQIAKVAINYPRSPEDSFVLTRDGNEFKLSNIESDSLFNANQKTINAYLANFQQIEAEYKDSANPNREEINKNPIFANVKVITTDGTTYEGKYISYMDISVNYETKAPKDIHPDNKFFVEAQDGEMYLIQQRVIGSILKPLAYFLAE